MKRRQFIAGLGSAAAWPVAARAQQPAKVPVIANSSLNSQSAIERALRGRLAEAGFVEGRNVRIKTRTVNGPRMRELVAEEVRLQPDVIVAASGPVISAIRAVTSTIPIVFITPGDPVRSGFVASLNRPGGNMTGVSTLGSELVSKQLDLLHQVTPQTTTIAYLTDLRAPFADQVAGDLRAAGQALVQQIVIVDVPNRNFEAAFASIVQQNAGAVLVGACELFQSNSHTVLEFMMRHWLPACYPGRGWCQRGGLMS
jgi:putative tryptophan/tyrosine transport system substrate-binding protein